MNYSCSFSQDKSMFTCVINKPVNEGFASGSGGTGGVSGSPCGKPADCRSSNCIKNKTTGNSACS